MQNKTDQNEVNEIDRLCWEQQNLNAEFAFNGVRLPFRGHWTSETDGHGIKNLICLILKSHNAVASQTDNREYQIAVGLLSETVIAEVRKHFGFNRYTDKTIQMYLAKYLYEENRIGYVQMTTAEDFDRNCKRPRCKYFLLA